MTILDLSRVSYATCEVKSRTSFIVTVGFIELKDAQEFHQWICERSKVDQRKQPRKRVEEQAADMVNRLAGSHSISADLYRDLIADFAKLINERREQGRRAVELFDECRRLQSQIASTFA